MITNLHPLGSISITNGYFSDLVGEAARNCFGVAAMSDSTAMDSLRGKILRSDYSTKGVRVTDEGECLVIELHIKVGYGVNIRSTVQSITHRVRDEVENATGLKVARINVCVDDIISE